MKLTGNCLKGSRPLLAFSDTFESEPHWKLMKELLSQSFGSPMGHPHVKPFVDHVLSFMILDNRIWFRNYQINFNQVEGGGKGEMILVEIGPRFVLNPIKIFAGSFGGKRVSLRTSTNERFFRCFVVGELCFRVAEPVSRGLVEAKVLQIRRESRCQSTAQGFCGRKQRRA